MPYKFTFDLSRISQSLFKEVLRLSGEKKVHKRLGNRIRDLVKRLRIERITGLNFSDAITVIEDLIDIQIKNLSERDRFLKTKKRALLLPHCARKYMDSRCKALFDAKKSSYFCQGCSPDCLVNKATQIAKKKGYDVYILPGGSCIPAIIKGNRYEGIVGVSCSEELKLGVKYLESAKIPGQGVPLIRNGCANTKFSIETLAEIL